MKQISLNRNNWSTWLFVCFLSIWLLLVFFSALSDLNITIQEGSNIDEATTLFQKNIYEFIFSGNWWAHQHLYHVLVYYIADLFNYTQYIFFIILGRILSIIFGFISIMTVRTLIKRHIKNIDHNLVSILQMFHPLFFFYSFQAEQYSMLFSISTLQLLVYLNIRKSKVFPPLFVLLSLMGYYTHFHFLIILFSECVNELFNFIKQKKADWIPCLTLFCLFIALLYQAPPALNSILRFYTDGYFPFSLGICIKTFATFFGITPLLFNDLTIYVIAIPLLLYTIFTFSKNHETIPRVIIIYFFTLLGFFLARDIIRGYLYGGSHPLMRHYIHIVLPIIISLMSSKKDRYSYLFFIFIIAIFFATSLKIVNTPYKYDGLSVIKYIKSLQNNNYIALINPNWVRYNLRNNFLYGNDELNLYHYRRTQIYDILYNDARYGFYHGGRITPAILFNDKDDETVKSLKNKILLDSGEIIEQVNDFIMQKRTTKILRNILYKKGYKLNPYEVIFIKTPDVKSCYKNRLMLEVLYPEYFPPKIRDMLSINRCINEIIISHGYCDYFHLFYLRELILGMDNVDTAVQEEALNSLLANPNIKLKEAKEFTNAKIYTFIRK